MKITNLYTTVKWQNTDQRDVPDIRDKVLTDMSFPHGLILEIGCAAGNFYERLRKHNYKNDYIGVDLNESQIERAKIKFPGANFNCGNILNKKFENIIKTCSIIVCFQVLEHIYEDIELIEKITFGTPIVFSVPNFPYRKNFPDGHKRHFELDGWVKRYEKYIDFKEAWSVKHYRKSNKTFVFRGVKR